MSRAITPATSLDTLKKEAKRWLKGLRAGDLKARARFERIHPTHTGEPVLRDVQHALAREHGHESWAALKQAVQSAPAAVAFTTEHSVEDYTRLSDDLVLAFNTRDEAALGRTNEFYGRCFTFDDLFAEIWRRVYAFRQRSSRIPENYLDPSEARMLIAQDAGFGSWATLGQAKATGQRPVPTFALEIDESRIAPRRQLSDREWDEVIAVMTEHRIQRLDAQGLMTDAVLSKVAALEHVTSLNLGGSRQLTDDGLLQLARMPQLRELELSEYPGGNLTDRGLEVLRSLPELRRFEMTWQRGISDAGVSNLRFCEQLERVDLMGSPTGNGAIEALQGKAHLSYFSSGRLVTDEGIPVLHNFPLLKHAGRRPPPIDAESTGAGTHLLIDGPITDAGLAGLAGLDGLVELDLFWHVTAVTPDGFAHLRRLPNLQVLGADGELSGDAAMRHIAAIPHLRRLRAQGTAATDEGFEALSRIEYPRKSVGT